MNLTRHPANPIVTAGEEPWRRVASFNPGVVLDADGTFYMLERACESLDPLKCSVGLLSSQDGVSFELVQTTPVLKPEDFDAPEGTVEDPRVVKIDGVFYMTFVFRRVVSGCIPNGVGVPGYTNIPGQGLDEGNPYRTGIVKSRNLKDWEFLGFIPTDSNHDRDNVLFPGKIGGRYAMLRRPSDYVGPEYGCDRPSIWISFSEDLKDWTDPELVATPQADWECQKIGAGTCPALTEKGWLMVYHGVDDDHVYRAGLMLLDQEDPRKVIGRTEAFIMEPETYYEKFGLIIPRVIFPSAFVVKDDTLFVYYGCTDTATSLATAPMSEVFAALQ